VQCSAGGSRLPSWLAGRLGSAGGEEGRGGAASRGAEPGGAGRGAALARWGAPEATRVGAGPLAAVPSRGAVAAVRRSVCAALGCLPAWRCDAESCGEERGVRGHHGHGEVDALGTHGMARGGLQRGARGGGDDARRAAAVRPGARGAVGTR